MSGPLTEKEAADLQQQIRELQAANELLTGQLLNKTADYDQLVTATLVSQSEYEQMFVRLQGELDSANKRVEAANYKWEQCAACVANLEAQLGSHRASLGASNQRIAELEMSNRDGQRLINELNWQLADAEHAKEAAGRKLAAVRQNHEKMMAAAMQVGVVFACGPAGYSAEYNPDLAKALAQIER